MRLTGSHHCEVCALGGPSHAEYAQERANATGHTYATFTNPNAPEYVYAAWLCPQNRAVYAGLGATAVRAFKPAKSGVK